MVPSITLLAKIQEYQSIGGYCTARVDNTGKPLVYLLYIHNICLQYVDSGF